MIQSPVPHTLFISDLHLDPSRAQLIGDFVHFLDGPARQAEALYILGDLFEWWIGDREPPQAYHRLIQASLKALVRSGVPVRFQHGNRDFLIGRRFAREYNVTLLPERSLVDLYGRWTLIEHGDLLCTDDVDYQRYRQVIRHPASKVALALLPYWVRRRIAGRLRQASSDAIAGKSMAIMDVNPQAVNTVMRKYGVHELIHGHTHRPAVHQFELDAHPATRVVLGDWCEQGSYLRVDESGYQSLPVVPAA